MTRTPLARSEGLVIEELGEELLVYDLDADSVHCLTPVAARVWRACDGATPGVGLADRLDLSTDEIANALAELDRCELLVAAPGADLDVAGGSNGLSRRDFGIRVAKVATAVATVPLILTVAAPAGAQAPPSVIAFCLAIAPNGLNNCNDCNQPTGHNTVCCCCHDTTNPALDPSLKLCAADPDHCCNTLGGSHCTEGNVNHQC